MDGTIDKDSNPFIKDSWIEQGYSFTPDRQELTPRLFKRSIMEIKSFEEENYYSYPAFLAIRWGFAILRNNILLPSSKFNLFHRYDLTVLNISSNVQILSKLLKGLDLLFSFFTRRNYQNYLAQ